MSRWQPSRALQLYGELLSEGHDSSCPESLLAFAHALAVSGQEPEAADVLHKAASVASTLKVRRHDHPETLIHGVQAC